jgi:large subunit ribosomal protein L31e
MAKDKKSEPKVVLEREYIVPLRSEWLKVPKYKRANKAVKALKLFMVRHMKVYDRDLRKIKIEEDLNNQIRFRGMKKPLAKIKVKAVKYDNDIVRVLLVDIPEHIKYKRLRQEKEKKKEEKKSVKEDKKQEKPAKEETKKEESEEKKTEAIEKEKASIDENLKLAKDAAKMQKHTSKEKRVVEHRKALAR